MGPKDKPAIQERGPGGSGGWLESACKLIVSIRAGLLLVTVIALPGGENLTAPGLALVAAGITSFIPLKFWDRIGPVLVRHPAYFAAELVLATVILVLTGTQSPFFYYTLATALLGGLLYGWPGVIVFSPLLVGVYYWAVSVRDGVEVLQSSFQADLGQPALYVVVAAAGAAARGLLDRQAEAEARIAAQERQMAAEGERSRLARDMHDSLAKTVSGIGFAALGLARMIERDPAAAAAEARRLAEDARQATREAREIITGLRTDEGGALPLPMALKAEAERWAAAHEVALGLAIEDVGELDVVASRELEWILREALRNAERHAHATRVAVRLRTLGGRAVMTISDDGDGFEVPDELGTLARGGRHFGVVGMRERAQLAGGDLSVESAPGEGCVLSVWVPAPEARRDAPAAPPPQPDAAPSDTVPRVVPGYTWQ